MQNGGGSDLFRVSCFGFRILVRLARVGQLQILINIKPPGSVNQTLPTVLPERIRRGAPPAHAAACRTQWVCDKIRVLMMERRCGLTSELN